MEEVINGILIREVETKNIMTKSSLPVGGYSVNPYVGCTHACKYCYASFMKRFTGHKEEWGTFLDVKHWPEIKNPKKYAGQRVVIGSVTDGYNPQEEQFGNTRKLLEQLIGSDADILICTKSDLVVRDIDLLKKLGRVTVSWSINTLDENFKNDMDSASSIEHRIAAMKQVYEAGIRTVCFVSPVFPGITDFEAIFERVKDQCDLFWLENLNLRGGFTPSPPNPPGLLPHPITNTLQTSSPTPPPPLSHNPPNPTPLLLHSPPTSIPKIIPIPLPTFSQPPFPTLSLTQQTHHLSHLLTPPPCPLPLTQPKDSCNTPLHYTTSKITRPKNLPLPPLFQSRIQPNNAQPKAS